MDDDEAADAKRDADRKRLGVNGYILKLEMQIYHAEKQIDQLRSRAALRRADAAAKQAQAQVMQLRGENKKLSAFQSDVVNFWKRKLLFL